MTDWKAVDAYIENADLWSNFIFQRELDSTNSFIRRTNRLQPCTVVAAGTQTQGRGKGNHNWLSPKGGLWFSILFGYVSRKFHHKIYLETLLSIQQVLSQYGVNTNISRPNDLVIDQKKIAGILIEEVKRKVIVGIGVNVNNDPANFPRRIRRKSTSMKVILGEKIDLQDILIQLLKQIANLYEYIKTQNMKLHKQRR